MNIKGIYGNCKHVGDCLGTKEEFGLNWCQEKAKGLWTNVAVLYSNEDKERDERF